MAEKRWYEASDTALLTRYIMLKLFKSVENICEGKLPVKKSC